MGVMTLHASFPMKNKPIVPKTQAALAEALEITPRQLRRWRLDADAPRNDDLTAWQAYAAAHSRQGGDDLKTLRAKLLTEQIQREKRRNAREARETMPLSEFVTAARHATACYASAFDRLLRREAPARLAGLALPELRAELEKLADELIDAHAAEMAKCVDKLREGDGED
jgi:hypothetical protein